MVIKEVINNLGNSLEKIIENSYKKQTNKSLIKLEELGIEVSENIKKSENFVYSINLNEERIELDTQNYVLEVTNAMQNHLNAVPYRTVRKVNLVGSEEIVNSFNSKLGLIYTQSQFEDSKMDKIGDLIWQSSISLGIVAGLYLGVDVTVDSINLTEDYSFLDFGKLAISSVGVLGSGVVLGLSGMFVGTSLARYIQEQNNLSKNSFFISQIYHSQFQD